MTYVPNLGLDKGVRKKRRHMGQGEVESFYNGNMISIKESMIYEMR